MRLYVLFLGVNVLFLATVFSKDLNEGGVGLKRRDINFKDCSIDVFSNKRDFNEYKSSKEAKGEGAFSDEKELVENETNAPHELTSKCDLNYRLHASDLIRVEVFKELDLLREVRVDAEGLVTLPLIGKARIGGMVVIEAQDVIKALYDKEYLVDSQINIRILETESQVQVLGQVRKPGYVRIPPEEKMTLTKAIGGAQGFNGRENQRSIQVVRSDKVFTVNFNKIIKAKNPDVEIKNGDTIFVPESIF